MSWQGIAIPILLIAGVAVEALCCLGLLAMPSTFTRLHFLGPAVILGATSIAAAVVVNEALSQAGIKAILIALALLATGPLSAHVTGRAAYLRHFTQLGDVPAKEEGR